MIREWGGIDRFRMDKYCLLIRKMVSKMLLLIDSVRQFVLALSAEEVGGEDD